MSAPIPDRPPATSPNSPSRRRLVLLVAAPLLAAVALGTGVALATRPDRPAVAVADPGTVGQAQLAARAAGQQASQAGQAKPAAQTRAGDTTKAKATDDDPASTDTAQGAAVLPDGTHHAYIRGVDIARDRVTVDVVQLFLDDDAVKAAIADGKPRDQARTLMVWLRNQNPRLRTLSLAGDLRVDFHHSCEESRDRRAVLRQLATNARLGSYFYSLTVRDGAVHAIKERQIIPAC